MTLKIFPLKIPTSNVPAKRNGTLNKKLTQFVYELFEAEKPDIVINFAAESHVDRSILNPELFLQTNVIGTGVLNGRLP